MRERTAWIALIALSLILFLGKSYETALPPNDTAFHSMVALNMTAQGALPTLPVPRVHNYNGAALGGFNDHPFTLFYLNGWLMRAFGPASWSVRLLPGVLAAGTVLLTGILGTLLCSEIWGFVAAFLLATNPEYIKMGATFQLDHPMIFFILLSFIFWVRDRYALAGVTAGLGAVTKNPVALLVVPVSFLVLLLEGKLRRDFSKWALQVFSALAVIAAFWGLAALIGGPGLVKDYWVRQVLGTAVAGRSLHHKIDWLLFFKYVGKRFLPWTILLVISLGIVIRDKRWREREVLIPLICSTVLFVMITPMRFKYDTYFLPAFPMLAILSVISIERFLPAFQRRFYWIVAWLVLIAAPILLITPISFAPELFPALKHFNAFIQSHGDCSDKVLFIPGGQPYADQNEYWIEVGFYTGRIVEGAACDAASAQAALPDVKWIMASRENIEKCLSKEARAKYKGDVAFGNQELLSAYPLTLVNGAVDLTPLERELHPVTDCRPVAYPRDRYHAY